MNRQEYEHYMNAISSGEFKETPYDDAMYLEYTQLNASRYNRWIKTGKLNESLVEILKETNYTKWTVITEPWCGDASHTVPFISLLSEVNPAVTVNYELRDSEPHRINQYLTNGTSKSIPIFIFSDDQKELVWGPRPQELTDLFDQMKAEKELTFEDMKVALQKWYNADKGVELQKELLALFKN